MDNQKPGGPPAPRRKPAQDWSRGVSKDSIILGAVVVAVIVLIFFLLSTCTANIRPASVDGTSNAPYDALGRNVQSAFDTDEDPVARPAGQSGAPQPAGAGTK